MNIGTGISPAVPLDSKPQQTSATPVPEEAAPPAAETIDSVSLSRAPEQSFALDQDDEARRAKVAAIREQLASGSYNISGRDVASKMLNAIRE